LKKNLSPPISLCQLSEVKNVGQENGF